MRQEKGEKEKVFAKRLKVQFLLEIIFCSKSIFCFIRSLNVPSMADGINTRKGGDNKRLNSVSNSLKKIFTCLNLSYFYTRFSFNLTSRMFQKWLIAVATGKNET